MSLARRSVAIAVMAGWILPLASFAAQDPETAMSTVQVQRQQPGGSPVTSSEMQRLAEREKRSQGLEQFAGGDDTGVYIGGGALLLVAIVLLIVLLVR